MSRFQVEVVPVLMDPGGGIVDGVEPAKRWRLRRKQQETIGHSMTVDVLEKMLCSKWFFLRCEFSGKTIAMSIRDTGLKYLSTGLWDQ